MGDISYKRTAVKWKVIMILICSAIILTNFSFIQAEQVSCVIGTGTEVYQYQQLMNLYELNSISYARSSITYQIEAMNGKIATDNYNIINTQYIELLEEIAQLNMMKEQLVSHKDTLLVEIDNGNTDPGLLESIQDIDAQITAIDTQIAQYNSSVSLSQENASDAKLQNDIAAFFTIYQQALTTEVQNVLKNNFFKLELDLIINKEKTDYLKANGQYLDLLYKIENIKFQYGFSTKSNIDKINVEILKNSNSLSVQEYAYSDNRNAITKETKITDNATIRYNFSLYERVYNIEQITQNFIENNTQYLHLRHLESCYQNYLNANNNLNPLISGQVQYKISDYKLQAEELREQISVYAKSAINSYQSAFRNMSIMKTELQLLNDNYRTEQAKFNNKKGTEVALSLANAEKEAGEIAYYQSCIEFIMWENIIDNGIYVK